MRQGDAALHSRARVGQDKKQQAEPIWVAVQGTFLRIFLSDSHLMEYVLSIQQVHRHSSSATALRSSDPTVYAHPALIRYKYAYHDSDRL